jgi:hypothetical protein
VCGDDGCVDPRNDPMHCGGCSPCTSDLPICASGKCAACDAGLKNCSGACVDIQFDFYNCGDCGKSCAVNQACINGMCIGGGNR